MVIMKRKFPQMQSAKVSLKKMEERKIQLLEGVVSGFATPKTPEGKTPFSFAMYVDDKLKEKILTPAQSLRKKLWTFFSKLK